LWWALLVLLNNTDQPLDLRLKLDWATLGFADWRRLKVDAAVFGGDVRIENGELLTPVGAANMRLLAITK
jgi:hypothetical protein